jgi:cell division initiation protein
MKITPLDIDGHTFKKKLRGYDPEEVRSFLHLVSEEYEKVFAENLKLQEDLTRMESILEEHRSREKTLQDTLLTAQRVSDDMKDQARREANLVIKEAEVRADDLLQKARARAVELEASLGELRTERMGFLKRLRALVEHHERVLELHEEDASQEEKLRVLGGREATEAQ